MYTVFGILMLISAFIGIPACMIWLVVSLVHKRGAKKPLLATAVATALSVGLFVLFGVTYDGPSQAEHEALQATAPVAVTPDIASTPSVDPTPTVRPTPVVPPTPTPAPTAQLTPTPMPTPTVQPTPEATPTPIPEDEENPMLKLKIQTKPVMNGLKTEQIGTWAYVVTTKETIMSATDEQVHAFLKEIEEKGYNWFNIFFEDGTGLDASFANALDYGPVDAEEGGGIPYDGRTSYTYHEGVYELVTE